MTEGAGAGQEGVPERHEGLRERHRRLFGSGASLERLVFFSDAVFAIAMTLLVLEIIIPEGLDQEHLGAALLAAMLEFFAYAVSFAVISTAWMNHHRKFIVIRRYDARLQWLNLLLLFFIAVLPMPTSFLSNYGGEISPWPAVLYASVTAAVFVMLNLIWMHAWRAKLMTKDVDRAMYRYVFWSILPVPLVFVLSIPLAFFHTDAAMYMWLLIIPAVVITRRIGRKGADAP